MVKNITATCPRRSVFRALRGKEYHSNSRPRGNNQEDISLLSLLHRGISQHGEDRPQEENQDEANNDIEDDSTIESTFDHGSTRTIDESPSIIRRRGRRRTTTTSLSLPMTLFPSYHTRYHPAAIQTESVVSIINSSVLETLNEDEAFNNSRHRSPSARRPPRE
jgi:hypothetical protein